MGLQTFTRLHIFNCIPKRLATSLALSCQLFSHRKTSKISRPTNLQKHDQPRKCQLAFPKGKYSGYWFAAPWGGVVYSFVMLI
ncbi:hypothetical protein I3842_01G299000 [Carya illinoinensis]|uniref:Uncharacterized protein n=1 Tax=Carya illinoinensis TaxID=32201 RepID=A0A922GAY4_CARIL|nr:hypothetical protein I3842_01G299000 [Carya illinoinensis]